MTSPFATLAPATDRPPALSATDVSYVVDDTAVGRMLLVVRDDGRALATAYAPDGAAEDRWLQRVADAVSPRVLRRPADTDAVRRALEDYLSGRARLVDVPTDLVLASDFQRDVLTRLATTVGYGERTTYARLAAAVDRPRAARAVGTALGGNPLCVTLPCHRVLPASGGVGGYAGGPAAKEQLLALESARG
ncbi:methylated-DNA--[protein]-cysteine S-methyltransferase [Phycicoccus sp. BSK3Z-2]|uniref:methylated-DNA--[protein]-cysteine S-methyltransferase n=1 Tax=Phycicoccus avicenniae TaxID=2828860 RepID=A0A941I0U5_9MICO|nr:methylated-DNA--[protein]-cysteine S-methyltransferase [Phycicoccus avicenniae]MBR7744275.1 methylated-DNA--[protein]-cysteine S-methyltransferase [Phycicoccus avicenniae]